MNRYVLDSDGLIKITKAGLLDIMTKNLTCIITDKVYDETVIKGKEKFYEDAFTIEDITNKKQLKIHKVQTEEGATGEISTLEAANKEKNAIIVTDDRKFISDLEEKNIEFLVPTDMIILLNKLNKINKKAALDALDKIKDIITNHDYNYTKEILGGKR